MMRGEYAEDPSSRECSLTVLFIHIFKVIVNQKIPGVVGMCVYVCVCLPVYGPEKILCLGTPTLQFQPVRQSVADGACP